MAHWRTKAGLQNAVFEHIPPAVLTGILNEGNRILHPEGLFFNRIDYTDHFSYSDKTISPINFLQYSDAEWEKYAGNRFMYMNRLRHDDFIALFESAGHAILATGPDVHEQSLALLRSGGVVVDERFGDKSEGILSIIGSWIFSRRVNLSHE